MNANLRGLRLMKVLSQYAKAIVYSHVHIWKLYKIGQFYFILLSTYSVRFTVMFHCLYLQCIKGESIWLPVCVEDAYRRGVAAAITGLFTNILVSAADWWWTSNIITPFIFLHSSGLLHAIQYSTIGYPRNELLCITWNSTETWKRALCRAGPSRQRAPCRALLRPFYLGQNLQGFVWGWCAHNIVHTFSKLTTTNKCLKEITLSKLYTLH